MSYANINTNNLFGRLVAAPEVKLAKSGLSWFSASVAVNHTKEESSFFDFKMFGKTAELFAENHGKGDRVLLSGYFKQETWKDPQTGAGRSKVVFIADSFEFLTGSAKTTTPTNF